MPGTASNPITTLPGQCKLVDSWFIGKEVYRRGLSSPALPESKGTIKFTYKKGFTAATTPIAAAPPQ